MNLLELSHVGSYGFVSHVTWSPCTIYNSLGFVCLLNPQIFCQCYKSPLKTLRLKGILSVILSLKKSVQEPADLPHGNRLVSEGTTVIFLAVAVLGILFTHFGFMFCIACKSLSSHLFMYILFPVLPYEVQYFSRFLKEAWAGFLRLWMSEKGFSGLTLHWKVLIYM